MKIEPQVLEALARLNSSEPKLVEFLQQRMQTHLSHMATQTDEVAMRWAQGRVQEASDLVQAIQNAGEILRKAGK